MRPLPHEGEPGRSKLLSRGHVSCVCLAFLLWLLQAVAECHEQELRDQGTPMRCGYPAGCTAALELSSALGCSSLWTWASFSCACSRSKSLQVGPTCSLPLVHALHCCAA